MNILQKILYFFQEKEYTVEYKYTIYNDEWKKTKFIHKWYSNWWEEAMLVIWLISPNLIKRNHIIIRRIWNNKGGVLWDINNMQL